MPRVAINIVTHNSRAFILPCLEAVDRQTVGDTAITVIDNASSDDTLALVRGWPGRAVRLIENDTNRGFAAAQNAGIDATDSAFVLLLNPDVIMKPAFLAEMLRAVESTPSTGSAAGKLLRIPAEAFGVDLIDDEAMVYPVDSAGLYMRRSRRQGLRCEGQIADPACEGPVAIFGPDGAAPLYRRAMLDDVRLDGEVFDESFHSHKEDVDLAWRAQLLGWDSVYTPRAVAYHVRTFRPGQRKGVRAEVRRNAVRNRWLLMLKNDLPGLFLRDGVFIAGYDILMLLYMLALEQRSLPAVADFIRLLPQMWRRRRDVMGRRTRRAAEMARWFAGLS